MIYTEPRRGFNLTTFLVLVLFITTSAWGQADDRAKQIEAAKKEGKLLWYTSTNVTESKPLLDDFEKQYPFIKGEIFRASGEKTLNRIATETRAGRWDFDLVTISEVDALQDAKMLAPYKSPEARSYIPEFKDPNGYWTAVYTNYAPIEWVNTVNPLVVTLNSAGLSVKPPHPNTARLFIDFLLSKPAQQRLRALRRIPARPDVEAFSPRMEQTKLKLTTAPSETGAQYREVVKEFREVFGL